MPSVAASLQGSAVVGNPRKCMHGRQHANRAQQWQCAPAAAAAAPRAARLHSSRGKTLVPRAAADTAAPDELAATWKGFRCFKMDTTDFLVKELADGRLDVSDAFVLSADPAEAAAQREQSGGAPRPAPGGTGEAPSAGPRWFHEMPWAAEYLGNALEGREARTWVVRTYLVALASREPYRLDFGEVYCLDDKARSLGRCAVQWLAPEGTAEGDLRLRVRDHAITVDTLDSLPTMEAVSRANLHVERAVSRLEEELAARQGAQAHDAAALTEVSSYGSSGSGTGSEEDSLEGGAEGDDVLYDDDTLKDFLVEFDDESADADFDFDSPASDY